MGIINQIKKMFSKNIDVADAVKDKIFYLHTTKGRIITIGANIVVPESFSAVFVCKDKITDILPQGKFAVSGVNLPKTFKRMGLSRANKKGKFPKTFVADLYFIKSIEVENMQFESSIPLKKNCSKFGKVKAHSEGTFTIKIEDPELIMKYLLMDRAYITDVNFNTFIKESVGNAINKILMDSKKDFYEILLNSTLVNEIVNNNFMSNKIWEEIGIKVSDIKVNYLNVDSKLKEKIENEVRKFPTIKVNANREVEVVKPAGDSQVNSQLPEQIKIESSENVLVTNCPNCGHKLNSGAVFCEKCGTRISKF